MEYVRLGNTGLKVSRICLGCLSFGRSDWREWTVDDSEGRLIVKQALERGINYFDTANVYSNGGSEKVLGGALAEMAPRASVVISTKVFNPMGPGPTERGLSRKHIFESVDSSLKRLGTDYIDLLVIHRFDPETPIVETVQALGDLVRAGKVLYLGASSMHAWQFMQMISAQRVLGLPEFVVMQNYYNLIYREEEQEMLPLCRSEGIAVTPWSPLARGFLAAETDTSSSIRMKTDTISTGQLAIGGEQDRVIAERVRVVARELGVKPAKVALSWVLGRQGVVAPVVGADAPSHVDEAVDALDLLLSPEQCAFLEEPYQHRVLRGLEP